MTETEMKVIANGVEIPNAAEGIDVVVEVGPDGGEMGPVVVEIIGGRLLIRGDPAALTIRNNGPVQTPWLVLGAEPTGGFSITEEFPVPDVEVAS